MKRITAFFLAISMLLTAAPVFVSAAIQPAEGYVVADSYSTDMSGWQEGMTAAEAATALGFDEIVGWSGTVAEMPRTVLPERRTGLPLKEAGDVAAVFAADTSSREWIPGATAGLVKRFSATEGKVYISFDVHVEKTKRVQLDLLELTDSKGTTAKLKFGAHIINNPSRADSNWGYNGGYASVKLVYDIDAGTCTATVAETQEGSEPAAGALNETQDFSSQVTGLSDLAKIKFAAPVLIGWMGYDNITIENHTLSGTIPENPNVPSTGDDDAPEGMELASSYSTDMSAWTEGMTADEATTALGLDEIVGWSGTVAEMPRTVLPERRTGLPLKEAGDVAAVFAADTSSREWIPGATAGLVKRFSATEGKVYISFDVHVEKTKRVQLDLLELTDSQGTTAKLKFGAHIINNPSRADSNWGYNGGYATVKLVYDIDAGTCTATVAETQEGSEPAAGALNETQDFSSQVTGLSDLAKIKFAAPVLIGWMGYDNISIKSYVLKGNEPVGGDDVPADMKLASSYSTDMSAWTEGMTTAEATTALGLDEIVGWSGTVAEVPRTISAERRTGLPLKEAGDVAVVFAADTSSREWIPNATAGLVKNLSAQSGRLYIDFDVHVEKTKRVMLNFLELTDSNGMTAKLNFGAHIINNPSRADSNWGYNGGYATVKLVYDLDAGTCTATVTENQEGSEPAAGALNETQDFTTYVTGLSNVSKIKFVAPILIGWMGYDNISIRHYISKTGGEDTPKPPKPTNISLNPADGSVIYEQPTSFSTVGFEGDTVFFLNGEKLGSGDENNAVTAPELPFGQHDLRCICMAADGTATELVSTFTFAKKVLVKTYTQNFDSIYTGVERVVDDTDLSPVSVNITQTPYARVSVVPGASGEADDGALKLEAVTTRTDNLYFPGLNINGFTGYDSGVSSLEFDIKLNSTEADDIWLTNPYLWTGDYALTSGGAWRSYNTAAEPFTTDWVHVKLTEDNDNKTVSFEVNGRVLANRAPWGSDSGGYYKNATIRISTLNRRARSEGEALAGFAIDNFKGEVINVYTPATAEVVDGGLLIHVPAGVAGKVKTDWVHLATTDGRTIKVENVTGQNGGKELFVAAKLPAGKTVEVTLSKDLCYTDDTPFERDNFIRVETPLTGLETTAVMTIGGQPIYTVEQLVGGQTVNVEAGYKNNDSAEADLLYIVTVRQNGRLVAIGSKTVGKVNGGASDKVQIPVRLPDDVTGCEIFLIACDSFESAKPLGSAIRIY